MKKKLTLAIAAYVLLVAGILTYIYCPRTVIKNTAMWYEKDFTIPIFCKTVEFKQLYDLGLYNGKFEYDCFLDISYLSTASSNCLMT